MKTASLKYILNMSNFSYWHCMNISCSGVRSESHKIKSCSCLSFLRLWKKYHMFRSLMLIKNSLFVSSCAQTWLREWIFLLLKHWTGREKNNSFDFLNCELEKPAVKLHKQVARMSAWSLSLSLSLSLPPSQTVLISDKTVTSTFVGCRVNCGVKRPACRRSWSLRLSFIMGPSGRARTRGVVIPAGRRDHILSLMKRKTLMYDLLKRMLSPHFGSRSKPSCGLKLNIYWRYHGSPGICN